MGPKCVLTSLQPVLQLRVSLCSGKETFSLEPECRAGTAVPSKEVLELCAGTLLKAANLYHMVFPVVMYGCESWTLKKAELRRISAFKLWCWRRLLRVPWTARRPNQSILKEINPELSLEVLMLKLKLQ